MKDIGYKLDIVGLVGDIVECRQRHLKAVEEDPDYISAHFTQEPTLSVFYNQLGLPDLPLKNLNNYVQLLQKEKSGEVGRLV